MVTDHPIVWDDRKVSRLWNYYSKTPPYAHNYFAKVYGLQILKKSRLPVDRRIKVLDFGCGPGFMWHHMVNLGAAWSYVGMDFSADAVCELQRQADSHPKFAGAFHIQSLPSSIADNEFDAVFLVEVLEHLNDDHLKATVTEVRRVLKTGGAVVVTTPYEEDLSLTTKYCPECGAIFHEWQHVRTWSRGSLGRYMDAAGFETLFLRVLDFRETISLARWIVGRFKAIGGSARRMQHMLGVFKKVSRR